MNAALPILPSAGGRAVGVVLPDGRMLVNNTVFSNYDAARRRAVAGEGAGWRAGGAAGERSGA